MKFIADEIKAAGYQSGIWLLPLSARKKSDDIFKNHPDWLVKDEKGKALPHRESIRSGVWDFMHWISIIRKYVVCKNYFILFCREWGCDIVEAETSCTRPVLSRNGRSRGGVMADAMALLREAIGEQRLFWVAGTDGFYRYYWYCHRSRCTSYLGHQKHWNGATIAKRAATVLAANNALSTEATERTYYVHQRSDVFMLHKKIQRLKRLNNIHSYSPIFCLEFDFQFWQHRWIWWKRWNCICPFSLLSKKRNYCRTQWWKACKVFFQIDDRRYMAYINLFRNRQTVQSSLQVSILTLRLNRFYVSRLFLF